MRIAATQARFDELLKSHSAAQAVGFEMHMLSPLEAQKLYPLMQVDDLIGAAFIPDDGHIDPNSLTQAYARGIRKLGGRIIEGVMVNGLTRKSGRITYVCTNQGEIAVDTVVNAAGLWARQVGWMAGVEIPAGVVEHQYLVTEKSDEIPHDLPAFRDPDGGYYAKPEPGALAIGGWEKVTRKVNPVRGFPWALERHLSDGDMDRIIEFLEPAMARLPILERLGVRTVINGPIPISPDGEPVMGFVPGVANMLAACSFTSGIAASGGAGKAAANWILHGDAGLDLWAFDIRRFGALHAGADFLHDRAVDSLRLEKRFLAWGVDITPDYTPLEAGLGFVIDWKKGGFIGREALAEAQAAGLKRKLVCLSLDEPLNVFGGEAILAGGKVVGQTTSGNFGYTIGKPLVLGYLPLEVIERGGFSVNAFGQQSPAQLVKSAAYDPGRAQILR